MSQKTDRHQLLSKSIEIAISAYESWLEDSTADHVPEDLELAIDYLVEAFRYGDLPGDMREPALLVGQIDAQWQTWKREHGYEPSALPGGEFMRLMNLLIGNDQKRKTPVIRKIEPVTELIRQGLSPKQIATVYEFKTPSGDWDVNKAIEEMEKPGTHTGEGWEDPITRRHRERAERLELHGRKLAEKFGGKAKAKPIAPESIEELIRTNVAGPQIAMMKGISLEELAEYVRDHELPEPRPVESVHDLKGIYDHDPNESQQRILDNMGPQLVDEPPVSSADKEKIEEAILAQYDADPEIPASQLAEIVSEQTGSQVSYQKVNMVLKSNGIK